MQIVKYKGECQFCGIMRTLDYNFSYNNDEDFIVVKYYHHHLMHLCDRCVDKLNSYTGGRDVDEYWLPEDAKRCGYPEFPYAKLINPREKYTESED